MWSHYADSHRGFIIGFDSNHSSIRNRKDGERYLHEVTYPDKRPKRETVEGFSLEQLFCTKSTEWTIPRICARTSSAHLASERWQHAESLFERGIAQLQVKRDKALGMRLLFAPQERRRQLEGIGRAQRVNGKQAGGPPQHR